MFKQFLQASALQFVQIDSCRMGSVNENLAVLLMAHKFQGITFIYCVCTVSPCVYLGVWGAHAWHDSVAVLSLPLRFQSLCVLMLGELDCVSWSSTSFSLTTSLCLPASTTGQCQPQ